MDLLDWHRGRLTSRRLAVLVRHLPKDSAVAWQRHGEAAGWGPAEYLLAAVADHLAVANWITTTINRDEHSEPPEYPEPVPRPGRQDEGPDEDGPAPRAEERAAGRPTRAELVQFFA